MVEEDYRFRLFIRYDTRTKTISSSYHEFTEKMIPDTVTLANLDQDLDIIKEGILETHARYIYISHGLLSRLGINIANDFKEEILKDDFT